MNTYIRTSENFHAGRGYPVNEQSSVKNVTIRPLDNGTFSHLVFQIPHEHIRPGAHSFLNFKSNGESSTFRKLLAMFIELITFMATRECEDEKYVKSTVFLETVVERKDLKKHSSHPENATSQNKRDVAVATRIHFLCDRKKSYPNQTMVKDLLKSMAAREKAKKRKPFAEVPIWEEHWECSDMRMWLQYLSAYSKDILVTEYDKMLDGTTTFDPIGVFSLQNACKLLKRGDLKQRTYREYQKYDEDEEAPLGGRDDIVFPREDLILQVTPQDISITNLFYNGKYLPCFFFERSAMPRLKIREVTIKVQNAEGFLEDTLNVLIKRTEHPFINFKHGKTEERLIDSFNEWNTYFQKKEDWADPREKEQCLALITPRTEESIENFYWLIPQDCFEEAYEEAVSEAFYLLKIPIDRDPPGFEEGVEAGIRGFLSCVPRYTLCTRSSHNFSTAMPSLRKLFGSGYTGINKHPDRMDLIKYQIELTRDSYSSAEDFEEKMMDLFATVIIEDEEADVSAPMSAMLKWYHHERSRKMWQTYRKDEDGSVFMNSIVWKLNFLETYACVRKDFQMMMFVLHGSLDAYRQELNLHINACLTGTGAVSKSFVMLKMKELRIPGTVTKLTYKTAKADAIDSDRNDTIIIFEEAPAGMFMKSAQDPEKEEMFKEKLTSMECSVLTWEKNDETGERFNREVKSQCIGVHFGATNDDPEKATDAMKTRFVWGCFEEIETDRSVSECMHGEQESKTTCSQHYNRCLQYFYMEQFQVMMVYKMIYIGLIPDPTMEAADVVYAEMEKELKKHKIHCPARFGERYRALCKIHTIINAINTVFNYIGGECCWAVEQCSGCREGGECCRKRCDGCQGCSEEDACRNWCFSCAQGNPCYSAGTKCEPYDFDPRDMLRVKPYLYCTEEIALYAFTQLSGEIYNSNEYKIKESIWKMWKTRSGKFEQINEATADMGMQKVDNYDRIMFEMCGKKLITVIKNGIPLSQGKPSEYNIGQVLNNLNKTTFTNKKYVRGEDEFGALLDGFPVQDVNGETRNHEGYTVEPPKTFFPLAMFEDVRSGLYIDPVVLAARACQHKFTYPDKKTILGFPEKFNSIIRYPSIFQTLTLQPNNAKVIRSMNSIFKTELDMKIQHRGEVLNEEVSRGYELQADTDDDACAAHGRRLGYVDAKLESFVMKYSMGAMLHRIEVDAHPIEYPREALENIKQRKNRENMRYTAKNTNGLSFIPRTSKRRRIDSPMQI